MITIDSLSHRHGANAAPILKNVCLEIPPAQSVALLGRSGSGKSTLLNLIAGIETLQQGDLHIGGQSMTDRSDDERTLLRRRRIGFIYQFFNLVPTLTVAENLSLPLELNNIPIDETNTRIAQWLDRIELAPLANSFPDTLSGGEQQRVAIARALIHKPDLLLADEPTGNLDAISGARALELLLLGAKEQSQTLIVVTHSRAVAERCDRVVSLLDGELFEGAEGVAW